MIGAYLGLTEEGDKRRVYWREMYLLLLDVEEARVLCDLYLLFLRPDEGSPGKLATWVDSRGGRELVVESRDAFGFDVGLVGLEYIMERVKRVLDRKKWWGFDENGWGERIDLWEEMLEMMEELWNTVAIRNLFRT